MSLEKGELDDNGLPNRIYWKGLELQDRFFGTKRAQKKEKDTNLCAMFHTAVTANILLLALHAALPILAFFAIYWWPNLLFGGNRTADPGAHILGAYWLVARWGFFLIGIFATARMILKRFEDFFNKLLDKAVDAFLRLIGKRKDPEEYYLPPIHSVFTDWFKKKTSQLSSFLQKKVLPSGRYFWWAANLQDQFTGGERGEEAATGISRAKYFFTRFLNAPLIIMMHLTIVVLGVSAVTWLPVRFFWKGGLFTVGTFLLRVGILALIVAVLVILFKVLILPYYLRLKAYLDDEEKKAKEKRDQEESSPGVFTLLWALIKAKKKKYCPRLHLRKPATRKAI